MLHHHIQKISSGKHSLTFWIFTVNLTLNAVIPFFHRTLRLMLLYYQIKLGCKQTSSFEDIVEIVIFWLYKPSLWPWHRRHWTNVSAWHFGSWCSITIPSSVTKWPAVQKISSRQIFTNIFNLPCDFDLECSNPIFTQDTPAYDAILANQVWLQTDLQIRRYSRTRNFYYVSPCCDLDTDDSEPIFLHDTSPHDKTPPY